MDQLAELGEQFVRFVLTSFAEVPLEVTFGTAVTITFIWLLNEVFGRLMLWRAVLMTVWGLVLIDAFFVPLGALSRYEMWAIVIILIGVSVIVANVSRKIRLRDRCPTCGQPAAGR